MKDLYVLTADAEMQAVVRTILARHQALGIRRIDFEVNRYPMRDSGMIKDGPEITALTIRKEQFGRVVLMWDHEGSGYAGEADAAMAGIQKRLDGASWANRSSAVAIVPELEEWFWHSPESLAKYLRLSAEHVAAELAGQTPVEGPKERLHRLFLRVVKRRPRPGDFEKIAAMASVRRLMSSDSFATFATTLRTWFPPEPVLKRSQARRS